MPFDPAYVGLAVPFLLLVLWYFERKRQRQRRDADEELAEEIAQEEPSRQLEALLFSGDDEDQRPEPTRAESFRRFLHGAPTRKLTLEWFWAVYHGLLSFFLLGALAVFIIQDAVKNPALRNVLIAAVSAVALAAWAWRIHADRRREEMEAHLHQVLMATGLACAAVIDREWHVSARTGNFAALANDWLLEAVMGQHGEAMTTYRALTEMPLPQVIVAGEDVVIADKPDKNIAVVAFARGLRDGAELKAIAAKVSAAIRTEFAPKRGYSSLAG